MRKWIQDNPWIALGKPSIHAMRIGNPLTQAQPFNLPCAEKRFAKARHTAQERDAWVHLGYLRSSNHVSCSFLGISCRAPNYFLGRYGTMQSATVQKRRCICVAQSVDPQFARRIHGLFRKAGIHSLRITNFGNEGATHPFSYGQMTALDVSEH